MQFWRLQITTCPPKIASKDHLEAAAKWQKCRFPIANMQSRSNGNCRQRPHNQLVSIIFCISKTSLVDKYLDEPQTPTPHFDNILMDSNPRQPPLSLTSSLHPVLYCPITSWQPLRPAKHPWPQQGMKTLLLYTSLHFDPMQFVALH